MKPILLFAFCILATCSFSQKSIQFKYVVNQPSVDTVTGAYYGMPFEFVSQRVYTSDNEFYEKGLFSKDSSQKAAIYFRHSGENWYIRNFGGKWQLLYSGTKSKPEPIIKLTGGSFRISWKEDEILAGKKVSFFILKPQGFIFTHLPGYFFDSLRGIVGLETTDVTLIREDFK